MATGRDIALGLRAAYKLMHRQTQALLSDYDFTAVQFVLLGLLRADDGISQQELTCRASSDPNTIRATLLLLERGGMVVRKSDKTDRRAKKIHVTAKGRRTHAKLSVVLKPLQEALLVPFAENEADAITAYLSRIAEAMTQWERR